MANARIRTLEFLPEIFQTPTNAQFLAATLDQLVNPPITRKIEGYIGSKLGYGVNAKDYYVTEPNKTRTDYQLDPGVIFTKKNENVAKDFISYPGILDALKLKGGIVDDNNRLFESQFYSWDSFSNLDKIINFNQYYWLPSGPPVVTVSTEKIYSVNDYVVTSLDNGYEIKVLGTASGSINPTITLLRGGTYRFIVDQNSQFFIQTEPSVSGYSITQPNLYIREVFGVSNNGAEVGIVEFTVPQKNDQDQYNFPGNNFVDVVSTLPYSQVNGQRLADLGGIDGVTSLNGLVVMFYNTGQLDEIGYTQEFFDENNYDLNGDLVAPLTINVTATNVSGAITCNDTSNLVSGQTITFEGIPFGGLNAYSVSGTIYYIDTIINNTQFTVTTQLGSGAVVLTTDSGTLTGIINQGLYEEGFYNTVNNNFYEIQYIGDPNDPVLKLIPIEGIPSNEKITAIYGTQWINRSFYKNTLGYISLIPLITAPLDLLYYQDGTSANKVGQIKLIENNLTNTLNVETDILGKKNYTAPNGVVFTNGLKVSFDGSVIPSSYLQGQYYVEGVGTAIELIPVTDLFCPEDFTQSYYIPYDTLPYDVGNYDSDLYIPVLQDYITIARNSKNKNAWSRSNRWFHIDVINASASYNNEPSIVTDFATQENKAKRPIIEFYPNLALFDSGVVGKQAIDFVDFRTTDALTYVAGQPAYYPDVETYTKYTGTIEGVIGTSTTATILASDVTNNFQVGQYITDIRLSTDTTIYPSVLPKDAQITAITENLGILTISIGWAATTTVPAITSAGFIANDQQNNQYELFDGARIVFAADSDENVKNKIYVANLSFINSSSPLLITLTEAVDGQCLPKDQTVVIRGYTYQGNTVVFDGIEWNVAQQKNNVNQPPLFDIFDSNGISFGDETVYQGTTFKGCKLFAYGIGSGINDSILGFPLRYSSVDNVGDISFDVSLNKDSFNYVTGTEPKTVKVNTGYVFNYDTRTDYTRELGWQTAVGPSVQYQVFSFDYYADTPNITFTCDIAKSTASEYVWPTCIVYVNNVLQSSSDYTVTVTENSTIVTLASIIEVDTVIQILLLSNQVSKTAYYQIPINLNNNPFNENLETCNIGDIRIQYQSIYTNAPNFQGKMFGANNYRDLGNLVPYGTNIIQNSASLVLPGVFLRQQNHNLFDAILFNSREYVKFKTLLVDTVNNTDLSQRFDPAYVLDDALDQLSTAKNQSQAFFWSDMLPNKAPYITKTYTFNNNLDTSSYPLSRIYDFSQANYYGVLVYLSRVINGTIVQRQLIKGQEYTVSTDSRSLTVTIQLQPKDKITVKEYNQTYGSYVPNTPTKLGLYPSFIPAVVLDSDYNTPTYFIRGHDGSFNKLYGDYDPVLGVLIDFRDQALLEFETRIYNNLKLSTIVPVQGYEVIPGFFRNSEYSYEEFLEIYSESFLNWIGQNRLNYEQQYYNKNDEFTYNYSTASNILNDEPIKQGYWRGVYQYLYDTTTPNETPWEMLGITIKPDWWESKYGPAPYTSDNLNLWEDLAAGINYNNGNPYVIEDAVRPELLQVIPVDNAGNLLSPFAVFVKNYNFNLFQRDWKVGDDASVELSYRRSSTWPFDLMRILALTKPARFFNLGVDLDNYKYNSEFNQYLVNDRYHLVIDEIEIYGNGIPKTSYINWIVDFEKQLGLTATDNIKELLYNLDVRLVYRLAGFSDKTLLKFYVEKGTPNSRNASLLIPDESYSVLLYDNQPFDRIIYSAALVQLTDGGYTIYGNSQNIAYFKVLQPLYDGFYDNITVENATVKVPKNYTTTVKPIPYGTKYDTLQEVANFLSAYGAYLQSKGLIFDQIEFGREVNWNQMIAEFLYWAQVGWEDGSVVTLNPSAVTLKFDKENAIVQPLTLQQTNFILNQNLYPVQITDMAVIRDGTLFTATPLNEGDSVGYGQFNVSNFEHGIVFDNITLFNDIIYNLVTGLRQTRITVRGTKTAEWNGTVNAYGFILNQDNIQEWSRDLKYTKGQIVKYKNKYFTALTIVQPKNVFEEKDWKETDYNEVQKGLLPNSSTRSYESTLYYNVDKANLEQDADLLSFGLIGYRPRDYLALADLTDITQVNVYKNLIKNKGTKNAVNAFKGANLPQGGIDYEVYENWAIKSGNFGGVLNDNFIEFRLQQSLLSGNPSTTSLINGYSTGPVEQEVPIYTLFNYGRPIDDPDVLSTIPVNTPPITYPSAGYVNFNDVKMSSYFYSGLANAVNQKGVTVPLTKFYVGDHVWLANYLEKWDVFGFTQAGQVVEIRQATNNTASITFAQPHSLVKLQPITIINFDNKVDGYYFVREVQSPYQVLINYSFTELTSPVTGFGIALTFTSFRVDSPSDIPSLPLINNEFTQTTVWVDEAETGDWAVYRKSINYKFNQEITKSGSDTFGSAVAYSSKIDYMIGDQGLGKVFRYAYNPLTLQFNVTQTFIGDTSFGSKIIHADNLVFISEPTSINPSIKVYVRNQTVLSDELIPYQTLAIISPVSTTNFGTGIAISGDQNWLYISDIINNQIYVYRKENIATPAGYFVPGLTYTISEIGDTDWESIGAIEASTGITFIATDIGLGTGVAIQCPYQYSTTITTTNLKPGSNFGLSISTDYYGEVLVVGAPNVDYSDTVSNWGKSYIYQRAVQNFEIVINNDGSSLQVFNLASAPSTINVNVTQTLSATNTLVCADATKLTYNMPVIFTGDAGSSGIELYKVYYINTILSSTEFTIKTSRTGDIVELGTDLSVAINGYAQNNPLFVTCNGTNVDDSVYAVIGSNFYYNQATIAGDVINVSTNNFILAQTINSDSNTTVGIQYGTCVDINKQSTEIMVGAPFEISSTVQEGAVYRYTNGGGKYGLVIGTNECNVTSPRVLLINGYSVTIPIGNAQTAAESINNEKITNITASYTTDNKLMIQVIDQNLTVVNRKLLLGVVDTVTLFELGLELYTETQILRCPHVVGPTQFGKSIKFNEFNSVVVGAPTGTRFAGTQFDFKDDSNFDNDTLFDNNATQFIDVSPNCGAVYMFDYIPKYNESVSDPGYYVYAQSVNNFNQDYGFNPLYGEVLDFNENKVIIGSPDFLPDLVNGQAVVYENLSDKLSDWSVYRRSSPVVDINRIQNTQLFSAETNKTLINLDYFDPLQGKLLGAVRQNIDYVSNSDPARYTEDQVNGKNVGLIWGSKQVGQIWFDTKNVRFVNYHQNDSIEYNAKYWGAVFPGSDVAVYSWITSNVIPSQYTGPGTPLNILNYSTENTINSAGIITPIYCFWVRNTNIVFNKLGKTLSDTIIQRYISNPKNSGISYMSPILPNTFALYNTGEYLNGNDTVLHIGYSTGTNDDVPHTEYTLIRENFPDDFLPGLPNPFVALNTPSNIQGSFITDESKPKGLYDRLLDSLSGVDEIGEVVPNPWLPKAVQSGVLARPRQSFFFNRFNALKNYLTYANEILAQYPIAEIRQEASFLFAKNPRIVEEIVAGNCQKDTIYTITTPGEVDWTLIGAPNNDKGTTFTATGFATGTFRNTGLAEFLAFEEGEKYNTKDYWDYINWWEEGYNDSTKSAIQVPIYADLSTLNVPVNTIVTVAENGSGKFEVYRYDGNTIWTRIGLEKGTIEFKTDLWDYESARLGFGDNFFDTSVYDLYPSEETRYIVRALNEQIYIDELIIHRNKSLILLFEYIQSETIESQNYVPWLNKTSLVDVSHPIRELRPIEVFQSDNQEFLIGYLNEVKPYHVVIKEFIFKYTGTDVFVTQPTDFDLPAVYNSSLEKFISPELVLRNASQENQYLPTNQIWQTPPYYQWYQNKGLNIAGGGEYEITILKSYLTLRTTSLAVDNAQGFPINGVIRIGDELIAYSTVDRTYNIISGLARGYNNTPISDHIPGEKILIDLPSVIVLDGGRGYINPPKITAYIDEELYGTPARPAVLEAIMSLDTVTAINVIDPGQGYLKTPEIRIEPAAQIVFSSSDVSTTNNTIRLYAPVLQTGDLVQYNKSPSGIAVGGLVDKQWYYINVLQVNPTVILALYSNYADAINDTHRIKLFNQGTGNDQTLNLGARATALISSYPIRENGIQLRFDRTTYNSQIIEWQAGQYYGAYFAGNYLNSETVASSSILLDSEQPDINNILASAQGAVFPIVDVENNRKLTWSSFIRVVGSTIAATNCIRLVPYDATVDETSSGSTIGFYVGMPIKFTGDIPNPLLPDTTYYVYSILNPTDFTVSETEFGTQITDFADVTLSDTSAITGQIIDTAILTVEYSGILNVTKTQSSTNMLTVPLSPIGTGGTNNFYIGLPVFFTQGGFGGVVENKTYFVTTVVDDERFTISEEQNPVITTAIETTTFVVVNSTNGFALNNPIIFTGTTFGGITAGLVYYIRSVVSETELEISNSINGPAVVLTPATGSCELVNQKNTLKLSTETGSMVMNVSLPISPGQVNGQKFTLYQTSQQYADISTGTISNLINRNIKATLGVVNKIAITIDSGGTTNFYVNMPIQFKTPPVGSGLNAGVTYYVCDYSGLQVPDILNPGQFITTPNLQVFVSNTSYDTLTCDDTNNLYVNMPIVFSGSTFGGIIANTEYFVHSIISGTTFKISDSLYGPAKILTTANGTMLGTGLPYIIVCDNVTPPGGIVIPLNYVASDFSLVQFPSSSEIIPLPPIFDISFVLGGYSVIITYAGLGFAVGNTITINGFLLGGVTPTNNLTITVDTVDEFGGILKVICTGTPAGYQNDYYLKVISPNQLEVYSDPLMEVPVSGINFPYYGFTTATVVETQSDIITVNTTDGFSVNDPVIFTGDITGGMNLGQTYYIIASNFTSTTFQISDIPGGTPLTLTNAAAPQNYTVAKAGSFAFLPEPFYFNQSIVKFNNRVYICLISNNDTEFVFGKWELLDSGDRRLNALDRVIGYYQPTVNMPGVDLTQLFTGVTYPNPTYLGNPFEPAQQFELDTILQGDEFYPTDVDLVGIIYDGTNYLAAANIPNSSAVLGSMSGNNWAIAKLTNVPIGATDIIYENGFYLITSTNSATPIFKSLDGISWSTGAYFAPGMIPLNSVALSLNSLTFANDLYVAVGKNIITSEDAYVYNERFNFNTSDNKTLYGVTHATLISGLFTVFDGFISVGLDTTNTNNIVVTSLDGITWTELTPFTVNGLYGITSNSSIAVAVGQNGVIYYSPTGSNWYGVNETQVVSVNGATNVLNINAITGLSVNDEIRFTKPFDVLLANTSYFVESVISSTQIKVTDVIGNPAITLSGAGSIPNLTLLFKYPLLASLNDVFFANSIFMAVGDDGRIVTSSDGLLWTEQVSGVSQNLQSITYVADTTTWTVVGDNNAIIQSTDNGLNWIDTSKIVVAPNVYEIEGANFDFGYGPEELVPGNIEDSLSMIVTTRPGTNWPVTIYAHTGYNVVSYELAPTSLSQTEYSWSGNVLAPAQIAVFKIDGTSGLSTTLYHDTDYTIDWINQTVILSTPISFSPVTDYLRIDVYEVGNGDQLVKSNTKTDPIRTNLITGFNEIYLNCNYSDVISNGSGVVIPYSSAVEVIATETIANTNEIVCETIENLVPNTLIVFQGLTFGNIVENATYYIKSVSSITNSITISATISMGVAGPTFDLIDATGLMAIVINSGTGLVWTDPIVEHNGDKLILGKTNNVVRTNASNNSLTTNSTGGLVLYSSIIFSDTIFGGVITPQQTYYIDNIIDGNEFSISVPITPGSFVIGETYTIVVLGNTDFTAIGSPSNVIGVSFTATGTGTVGETGIAIGGTLALTNATGNATFVTNDYALAPIQNSNQAKIVFAAQYDNSIDYIVYSVFGETEPQQYGYTIPETEVFVGDGSQSQFNLTNYVGGKNPKNAIVEINGIRQTYAKYSIDPLNNVITFNSPPVASSTVAVTTYNTTDRQYLGTQYGITSQLGSTFIEIEIESTNHTEVLYDEVLPPGYGFDSSIATAGDFIIGQEYVIKTLGTTDFTLIGAASNTVGLSFVATGYGTGTGTAYGPGFFNEDRNWLSCAPGYDTLGLNINDPIIFSAPTLDGIIPGVTYYIIEIWNLQDFVISDQMAGESITLTNDNGSMMGVVNGLTVANIVNIDNALSPPLAITYTSNTNSTIGISAGSFVPGRAYVISSIGTTDFTLIGASSNTAGLSFIATGIGSGTGTADLYDLTVDNVTNFVIGQTIEFRGVNFGGLNTSGLVYFIYNVYVDTAPITPVNYVTICDENQNIIQVVTGGGNLQTIVGGVPAVRVTTGINHNLNTGNKVRIDGTEGSVQLNGNAYYVHKISNTVIDLYTEPYKTTIGAVNFPVASISSYTGNGYIWLDNLFTILTTNVYSTDSVTNIINVESISDLVEDTPISFVPDIFFNAGDFIVGKEYSIRSVGTTDFTLIGADSNNIGVVFTATGIGSGDGTAYGLGDYEIFGNSNILPKTTYYIKELKSSVVDAGYFVIGTSYTIAFVGTTDFTALGAISNTIGTSFVATGTGSIATNGKAFIYGITISEERNGPTFVVNTSRGTSGISQWSQYNVDRIWATIDGYRVPSSSLRLYDYSNLGILSTIQAGQEVILTSMIPSSTPDQETYMLNVSQENLPTVYRANTLTRTWLTEPLSELDDTIYVNDVSSLTNNIIQNIITPALSIDGKYRIGLTADKDLISNISVYNNDPSRLGYINSSNYEIVIEDLSPILLITPGPYIQVGDSLTISTVEGNTIIINGEQIKFTTADLTNNTLSGLLRGANRTGIQVYIPVYATVYSVLSANKLSEVDYNQTWNSNVYNPTQGDPLQISTTSPAQFLYTDVT